MAKKVRRFGKKIFILSLVIAVISVSVFYINHIYFSKKTVLHKTFGVYIPSGYTIHGIDVSHYQQRIDWSAVKQMQDNNTTVSFAFIKATEGTDLTDINFRNNFIGAKQAKVITGAYHFFRADVSGKLQAEHFIETVQLTKGDLPPVLDVEQTNGASGFDVRQRMKDWLIDVEKNYKAKPIIYTNVDFYNSFLEGYFEQYQYWIAHYDELEKPGIVRPWLFWQHSDKAFVNGIREKTDLNIFNGDSSAFSKILIK